MSHTSPRSPESGAKKSAPRGRMPPEQFQRIAKALADPRRFEMLQRIARQDECACQALCGAFPVSQATISHHLKELVTAGLVVSRREGQFVYCTAQQDVIAAYIEELRRRVVP